MKRLFCILLLMLVIPGAMAEEISWIEDILPYHDQKIQIHAIIDDEFPMPLQRIKIEGVKELPSKEKMKSVILSHFSVVEDFQFNNPHVFFEDYFYSTGGVQPIFVTSYDVNLIYLQPISQVFPIQDAALAGLYQNCLDFLREMNISVTSHIGYASYIEEQYAVILIPYQIEGLSTEYENGLVVRDRVHYVENDSRHIMDYPWAAFAFTPDGKLIRMTVSMFDIAWKKEMKGTPIPWKEAAERVLTDLLTEHRVGIRAKRDWEQLSLDAEDYEAYFFQTYTVKLVRVLPMWLPDWENVCVPGWCIRYELYDRETGEFIQSVDRCVHAVTGKVT